MWLSRLRPTAPVWGAWRGRASKRLHLLPQRQGHHRQRPPISSGLVVGSACPHTPCSPNPPSHKINLVSFHLFWLNIQRLLQCLRPSQGLVTGDPWPAQQARHQWLLQPGATPGQTGGRWPPHLHTDQPHPCFQRWGWGGVDLFIAARAQLGERLLASPRGGSLSPHRIPAWQPGPHTGPGPPLPTPLPLRSFRRGSRDALGP